MGYYDFPHTRNYDTDLGYLIDWFKTNKNKIEENTAITIEKALSASEEAIKAYNSATNASNSATNASNSATNASNSAELALVLKNQTEALKNLMQDKIDQIDTNTNRINNLATIDPGSITSTADAELVDIRVGDNGITYPSAGDSVRGQISELKGDLDDFTVESEEKKTHMENPEHRAGYWWNGEHTNDSYFYVKLSVNAGDVIHAINTLNNRVVQVKFVDAYSGANRVGDASSSTYITEYTVPATVDTLYLSINAPENERDHIQFERTTITVIKSIIVPFNKNGIMTKISSLASGYSLTVCENFDVKKNQSYRFYARFDTFDSVYICHGYNKYGGSWIEVGETNITAYYYNGSAVQMGQWAHGLAISDFVEVIVNVGNVQDLRAKVTVVSKAGDFIQNDVPMGGCTGTVSAFGRQSMKDVYLSYSMGDLNADVWLFGDSYTSLGDPNRWTYKLMDYGYKNLLMSGFSGATSAAQIKSFRNLVSIGRPKYLVWALGMNDPDADGAVNTSWKESFDEVSAWCNLYKIQFIACTIPNTPQVRNVEKNEIVRLSGYRYVDFAKAVNAEKVGSTWYPGMLSTDNVHPTELGAKVLANRFLVDVPEVMS